MPLTSFSLLAAFGAGILSFLSPCVVPLVPGYLSYLADTSLAEVPSKPAVRWRVSQHALWFVLGSVVFVTLLGVIAAALGNALSTYQQVLEHVGGLLLMVFGIALTGWVPLPWLSGDHRVRMKPVGPGRSVWWRSGLIGMTFGAGWSVCSTPILGAVLVLMAARSLLPLQAVIVMLAFGIGQGVPFLLAGVLVDRASPFLRRIPSRDESPHGHWWRDAHPDRILPSHWPVQHCWIERKSGDTASRHTVGEWRPRTTLSARTAADRYETWRMAKSAYWSGG